VALSPTAKLVIEPSGAWRENHPEADRGPDIDRYLTHQLNTDI
jgi:hypothetical protein